MLIKRFLHIKIRGIFKSQVDFRKVPKLNPGDIEEKVARGMYDACIIIDGT